MRPNATSEKGTADPVRVSVRSAPLDSARVVGSKLYHEHAVWALGAGERPELSVEAAVRPAMTVGLMSYSGGVRIESACLDGGYQVNIPLDATFRTANGDDRAVVPAGSAALYRRNEAAVLEGWSRPARLIALKLSGERVLELARERGGRRVTSLEFPVSIDLRSLRGREWFSLVRILANPLAHEGASLGETCVGEQLERPIIDGLLVLSGVVDHVGGLDDDARDADEGLRSVVEFVDQHAEQHLTVATLASIAGTSIRSLQLAFRATFDQTPLEYVRGVRLERAHTDLSSPSVPQATVSAVAHRWGFGNVGRFAAAYVERFGEAPKDTLRKNQF